MIRLTVARYYTPAGRCIQKPYTRGEGGAKEVDMEEYHRDLIDRYNSGELMHEDSIHFPDSLAFKTNKLHRTVYGGGGIMPDYFVPLDTIRYTSYHSAIVSSGALNTTVSHYVDNNRKTLEKKYKNFEAFNQQFTVDENLQKELIQEAEKVGVRYNDDDFQKSKSYIFLQLKALIARDIWEQGNYYQVINTINSSYLKALEVLNTSLYEDKLRRP